LKFHPNRHRCITSIANDRTKRNILSEIRKRRIQNEVTMHEWWIFRGELDRWQIQYTFGSDDFARVIPSYNVNGSS